MVGLFGNRGNGSGGGILGGASNLSGWDAASLIASGLQDANAAYRGQQGGNLDDTMQLVQRRALLAGLNSPDPDVRQRAYQQAALHGIDTKPFQQAQVNKATPGLLDSMQNGQSLSVPQVTGALPGIGHIQGGGFNMQTGPLSVKDALANAPPELQQTYLPKLLDTQMAADAKASEPRDYAGGTNVYQNNKLLFSVPIKPNPNEPFNADGTPNKAYQDYQVSIARERAKARADFRAPPKAAAPGAINIPHPAGQY